MNSVDPWGLSQRQRDTLTAICTTGCNKLAADALGISFRTVEYHIHEAMKRMGTKTRVLTLLQWDRHNRSQP